MPRSSSVAFVSRDDGRVSAFGLQLLEFRHRGRPIEPLKALDQSGRVVFIGTFSRTMIQDIRIGYAVLPPALARPFSLAKQIYERHPSSIIEQRALARFMESGLYDRHSRKMRRVYNRKAVLLSELLAAKLSHLLDVRDTDTGLHLYARWLRTNEELDRYLALCEESGALLVDARSNYSESPIPSVCLGFAHLDESQMAEGVDRLVRASARL